MDRAARIVSQGRVAVLTGAGISVDSGIPDFRSPGGLWTRFSPEEYCTIEAFRDDPVKVWELFFELGRMLGDAKPNAGHLALARLEQQKLVTGVVTQNIDGLHQAAGSKNVIEFHGSGARLACMTCGRVEPSRPVSEVPRCPCGQVMKPDVVLFGEMIPPDALRESRRLARDAACCLVCGTSAQVYPAAAIPRDAQYGGAEIIEVNLKPTGLTGSVTTVFLEGSTTEILPELARLALERA
ncbi:MAG: NAD-dependent deacylase [Candidatus Riflebacteria bacterium]|nr:NAD-dependent deacylase [Candidatus Riflebacteria bacterium]